MGHDGEQAVVLHSILWLPAAACRPPLPAASNRLSGLESQRHQVAAQLFEREISMFKPGRPRLIFASVMFALAASLATFLVPSATNKAAASGGSGLSRADI